MVRLACLLLLLAAPAAAEPCADRARIVERLAATYGETLRAARERDGAVAEIFASAETGTWSLVVTRAGGPACLVASGRGLAAPPPERGT